MPISDNLRGALYMNVAMAGFTLNDACMKAATQSLPLWQSIAMRGMLTLGPLVLVALHQSGLRLRLPRRDYKMIGLRSVGEVASTLLFLAALVHMPIASLSAIMQSLPLAVTLAAWAIFGEKVGWRRLTAILIGFAGVLIIIRPGPEGFDHWSLMGLASVAFVVVRDLSTREMSAAVPSSTVAVLASLSVTVTALVLSLLEGWQAVSLNEGLTILAAAASLVVGYNFVVMTMRVGDIGFVAPFRYTSLLWAIFLGWAAFGTLPDALTLLGAALVVGSGIFTLWRERRVKSKR
ncbi:DMT family transporter [Paragemmobacter straminiformis]|uniref:DMT family transporter n=1 Tax=Paragemmobacter straminiformis TaxID=2045119 RepID=A0A842ICX7_9RHOB|nr:DMT family transporter [Gemmobacter straminiformis]MBC2836944.1 DMT family transporter [Gemmobacter straminiformis]